MESDKPSKKMIEEAVRRVLVTESDMTINGDRLKDLLRNRYEAGMKDMFSLVKEGRRIVHTTHSGHL